jgi:hypothetical protein
MVRRTRRRNVGSGFEPLDTLAVGPVAPTCASRKWGLAPALWPLAVARRSGNLDRVGQKPDQMLFLLPLRCAECSIRWEVPTERWRVYFTDDVPPEPVSYCPACARREFGD